MSRLGRMNGWEKSTSKRAACKPLVIRAHHLFGHPRIEEEWMRQPHHEEGSMARAGGSVKSHCYPLPQGGGLGRHFDCVGGFRSLWDILTNFGRACLWRQYEDQTQGCPSIT